MHISNFRSPFCSTKAYSLSREDCLVLQRVACLHSFRSVPYFRSRFPRNRRKTRRQRKQAEGLFCQSRNIHPPFLLPLDTTQLSVNLLTTNNSLPLVHSGGIRLLILARSSIFCVPPTTSFSMFMKHNKASRGDMDIAWEHTHDLVLQSFQVG